jgi:hypothetical protein
MVRTYKALFYIVLSDSTVLEEMTEGDKELLVQLQTAIRSYSGIYDSLF